MVTDKSLKSKSIISLMGIGIGIAVTFLIMLFMSFIMSAFSIDRALALPFATVSIGVGSFVASFFSAKKIGEKGYLIGFLIGLTVFSVVECVSLIVSGGSITINSLFHLVIIILASSIGGILGVHKGKKKYI